MSFCAYQPMVDKKAKSFNADVTILTDKPIETAASARVHFISKKD